MGSREWGMGNGEWGVGNDKQPTTNNQQPTMKIYLYLKHFPPDGNNLIDGPSKSTHGFASGLVACGEEVTILCERKIASSFKTNAGYKIECFANPNEKLTFKIADSLKQYILERVEKTSIVIINGLFHPSVYSVSRILKKHSIPYIMSPRSVYHPSLFWKNPHVKWPYWYLFEKKMLKEAKALQLQDSRQAQWLKPLGVETPVVEVPNGFFPKDVPSESSLQWYQHETPKLFFFGRIDANHKGLDLLFDALALMAGIADAKLVLQGPDGGDRINLEQKAQELSISEKVSFINPDYHNSASSIIAKYDIFCLPSRFEGFANSGLEAMAAGRVLLVSETSGNAPHVQASGCGIVVKPEVSSIKEGLIELIQRRSEWQEMGLKGRHYVLEYLNWHSIAATTLKHYQVLYNK